MLDGLIAARVMYEMGYVRRITTDFTVGPIKWEDILVRLMSENKLYPNDFELLDFRRFHDSVMNDSLNEISSCLNDFSLVSGLAMFGKSVL